MRKKVLLFLPFFYVFILILISGCESTTKWDNEANAILREGVELDYKHRILNASVDSLWNVTTDQLASSLPVQFPSVDRDIFLKARNADHIRMFMSFKTLDESLQQLVHEAGDADQILASKIKRHIEQRQEYEIRRIEFLRNVEREDPVASRKYAHKFRAINDEKSI